jgi:predicted methyltransferase
MKILIAFALLTMAGLTQAANEIESKVNAALAAESRPMADQIRDENRAPLETLNFFGMKDNMRVLELLPGGGWYTRVLAPVLAENGKLYISLRTDHVREMVLSEPEFEQVQVVETTGNVHRPKGSRVYVIDDFDFDLSDLDMVLTFRNMHNFDASGRARVNKAVFAVLKPGGLYGIVDHTRRHMERDNRENRRRLDPVLAIKEVLAQGFELVDFSDLHFRADDELEYEVGRRSVSGNTDRFTLLFRKP